MHANLITFACERKHADMRKYLFILLALLPLATVAKDKNNTDPKYLAGAVTLDEDGKVSFTKGLKILSMQKDQIYDTMLKWAEERFKPEDDLTKNRVVYANREDGDIVATAEEYIVFASSALSLDRTRIYYQFRIHAEEGSCDMTMTRIRYWYDENRDGGEKYTAEGWITDDMGLNKKKTKLAPICGKFRRETIDLKDELFASAAEALGMKASPRVTQPTSVFIANGELKEVTLEQLPSNLNEIAEKGRITLSANGKETEITAGNWGGFGKLLNKDVAYTLLEVSKTGASALMENATDYKVLFYMAGIDTPCVIISCRKSMSKEMTPDEMKSLNQTADSSKTYTMYIGEITGMQTR